MIPWYKSKLVWQNVFITLIGVCLLVADYFAGTPVLTAAGISTLLAGVFGIVVRVWFTDTQVDTPKAQAQARRELWHREVK